MLTYQTSLWLVLVLGVLIGVLLMIVFFTIIYGWDKGNN